MHRKTGHFRIFWEKGRFLGFPGTSENSRFLGPPFDTDLLKQTIIQVYFEMDVYKTDPKKAKNMNIALVHSTSGA
jgi:hypothetical protein